MMILIMIMCINDINNDIINDSNINNEKWNINV